MDNAYKMLEPGDEPVCDQVCGSYADKINKEAAFGGTISLSLSHCGQNMYQKKAPAAFYACRSSMSRHHPGAQVALQQSPILQGDRH